MNITKRIFSIFLALAIVLSLYVTAFAQPMDGSSQGSPGTEVQGESTLASRYQGTGSIYIKSVGTVDASMKDFCAYQLLDLKLYSDGTEIVARQYSVPAHFVAFYAMRYGLDSNALDFGDKVAAYIQKDDLNRLFADMAEILPTPCTGKSTEEGYDICHLPLGIYLVKDSTKAAAYAQPAYPLTLAITDPDAVIENVTFEETETTDCLYFDFEKNEHPAIGWTQYRATDIGDLVGKDVAPYIENGHLVISNVYNSTTVVEYNGAMDYRVKATDCFEITLVPEGYLYDPAQLTLRLTVDGVLHEIDLGKILPESGKVQTFSVSNLGPVGKLECIGIYVQGYELWADYLRIDSMYLGAAKEDDPPALLHFDFSTDEAPAKDWAESRYSELDISEPTVAPYIKDGYLVISDIYIGHTQLDYVGEINYTVKPTDRFQLSFEVEGYNGKGLWVYCNIVVDGVLHNYSVCHIDGKDTGGIFYTEPLGLSGHVDSFSFYIFGFEQSARAFKVDYIAIGPGIAPDPGKASLELVNVNSNNYRLNDTTFSLSSDSLSMVSVTENVYTQKKGGDYWKLITGAYTTLSPYTIVDGVPVDRNTYDDLTITYTKESIVTTMDASTDKTVYASVGEDGILRFSDLFEGYYTIRMTRASKFYELLDTEITIQIIWNKDTAEYEYVGAVSEKGLGRCTVVNREIPNGGTDDDLTLSHSLNLASDITLNYIVPVSKLEGYDPDSICLEVFVPEYSHDSEILRDSRVLLYPELRGENYYFPLKGLTAVQLNDRMRACLYGAKDNVKYESQVDLYCVVDYAMSMLHDSNASTELKTVCANLLRYGSLAQQYKNYRTDALADTELDEYTNLFLTDLSTVVFSNNYRESDAPQKQGFVWNGKGLDLNTKVGIVLRVRKTDLRIGDDAWKVVIQYRNKDNKELTYEITGDQMEQSEDRYTFTFSELDASELRNVITATVCDAEGQPLSATLTYSADTYGYNKTSLLGDLCKALFAYSDSARAYFVS